MTWPSPSASSSPRARSGPRAGPGRWWASCRWAARCCPCRACCRWSPRSPARAIGGSRCRHANVDEARMVEGVGVAGVDGLDDVARLVAGPRGRTAGRRTPAAVAPGLGVPCRERRSGDHRGHAGRDSTSARARPGRPRRCARAADGALGARGGPGGRPRPAAGRVAGRRQDAPRPDRARPAAAARRPGGAGGGRHPERGRAATRSGRATRPTVPEPASHDLLRGHGRRRAAAAAGPGDARASRACCSSTSWPSSTGTCSTRSASRSRTARWRSRAPTATSGIPARLQLIAAMNPCRCGWYGEQGRRVSLPARGGRPVSAAGQRAAARPDRPAGGDGPGPARGAHRGTRR